jgi:hypothetical protein
MEEEVKKGDVDYSAEYLKLVPVILKEVIGLYGPRVGKVRFSSIIFDKVERPELDYEEFFNEIPPDKKKVNIAMTPDTKQNWEKGLFQLSHEVVHLLSTLAFDDDQVVNNLEEGVAVHFSKIYTEREANDDKNFNAPTHRTGYHYAYNLVEQLLAIDDDAVKKLRKQQPFFQRITAADFVKAGLLVDDKLITELLANFIEIRAEKPDSADEQEPEGE